MFVHFDRRLSRLALSLAFFAGLAAPAAAQSTPLGFDTVFQSAQAGGGAAAENVVIRDDAAWAAALARYRNLSSAVKPDFRREIAIIAYMGVQNTGGHSVTITGLEQDNNGIITAAVKLRFPGPAEFVTQALTSPIHVIKLTGSRESVRFDVTSNRQQNPPGPLKFIDVARRALDGGNAGAENVVVRDDAAWSALVARRPALAGATKPDFDEEMAIGVFLGPRSTGGYSANIDEIELERSGRITVRATATSPAPGQIVTQAFTSPFHVVATRKIAGAVNFSITNTQQQALGPVSFATIDQGAFSGDTSNNPQNIVFRNNADFAKFWALHSPAPLPQVDFRRETVVAALAGRKTSGGHSITVRSVERVAPGQIDATIETQGPPPGGFATTVITYPYHIVRMKAVGDQFTFKSAAVNPAGARFDVLTLVDNRDIGQGNYLRTTIELRSDGTATRSITSPFIRSQPITGKVTKAELTNIQQLFADTDFFNQAFPVPILLAGNFSNLRAINGSAQQAYDHQTGPLGPPKGQEVFALEEALRRIDLTPANPAADAFDTMELVIDEGAPSGIVATTTVNADGSARRVVVGPTIRTRPIEGFISDGDLATLRRLLGAADLYNQSFPIPSFIRGTPTTALTVAKDSERPFILYGTNGPTPGAKPRELQALVDFVKDFEIRERAFTFDSLSYNESFFGFILESDTITIQADGSTSISRSTPGGAPTVTAGKLSVQELARLQSLFDATDFFNQSFPQPIPGPGGRLNTITAENGGRNQVFSYPAGSIAGPKAAELQALEAFLKGLLNQQTGTRKYDEIEYAVLDDASQQSRQLFIRDGEVQYVLARAGTSIDKAVISLSQDEKVALQAAFGRANVFNQPDSFPELGAPSGQSYTLTARAGRDAKTIKASTASSGPRDYEAFRQSLDALLDRFKAREIEVEGIVEVLESFPVQIRIRPDAGPAYSVVGDLRDELEALGGRRVKVRGTEQPGNGFQVLEILSPKEIVFTGTIARSGGRLFIGEDIRNTNAQLYRLSGPLAASLAGLNGQVVTLRGLAFETADNRGILEVSSIFARARARAPAYPFGSLSQGELVEIKGIYGRLSVVEATIDGTNDKVQVITFTSLLRPVAISTPGFAGALRGSGK